MKKYKFVRVLLSGLVPAVMLASCNYLDVLPPEQADAEDTMKDRNATLAFLYSTYNAILLPNPMQYRSFEGSTDEYVEPQIKGRDHQYFAYNQASAMNRTPAYWNNYYSYIGQIHLFQREIARQKPVGMTQEEKDAWTWETRMGKAFYHMRTLWLYGPCPLVDEYLPMDATNDKFPGRRHFDYISDWVVSALDEAAQNLPATRPDSEWGRFTSGAALAFKSRHLLYAASPMWNGGFPFPEWKNEKPTGDAEYDEKYGLELVNMVYDHEKWKTAYDAAVAAINHCEGVGGNALWAREDARTRWTSNGVPLPYIPGMDETKYEAGSDEYNKIIEFKENVLTMRYMIHTYPNDGNREYVFGLLDRREDMNLNATYPLKIIYNGNSWSRGNASMSPTLNTIERFYTRDGYLPSNDPDWGHDDDYYLSRADAKWGVDREEIINLHVDREPRFYAWMSFDGDDYSSKLVNGRPLRVRARTDTDNGDGNRGWGGQGYTNGSRDYSVTGYHLKKFTHPNAMYGSNGNLATDRFIFPYVRLSELYLNAAEAAAEYAAGDKGSPYYQNALDYLNPIRERAGIPALTREMIDGSDMSLIEWIRNERFIELWGEAHRYFDVRRWKIAPQMLNANAREGLNGEVQRPSFEVFNRRTRVNQPFRWDDRMYLMPIGSAEVYANPQLVQSPGY